MTHPRSALFTASEVALLAWFDRERKRIATTVQILKQVETALRTASRPVYVPTNRQTAPVPHRPTAAPRQSASTQRQAVPAPNALFLRAQGLPVKTAPSGTVSRSSQPIAIRGLVSSTADGAPCRCHKPWACTCGEIPHAHFGGLVKAPPGPPHRDTGVIRIPLGGYVLPAETVRALGGTRVLDDLVEKTTGRRPTVLRAMPAPRRLLGRVPGYEDGGGLSSASDSTTSSDWMTPYFSPPPDTIDGLPNYMGVYPQELGLGSSQASQTLITNTPMWNDATHQFMNGMADVLDTTAYLSGSTTGSDYGNQIRNNASPLSPHSLAVNDQIAKEPTWWGKATIAAQNPGVVLSDLAGAVPPFVAGAGAGLAAEGTALWGGASEGVAAAAKWLSGTGVTASTAGASAEADPANGCPPGPDGDDCRRRFGNQAATMSVENAVGISLLQNVLQRVQKP